MNAGLFQVDWDMTNGFGQRVPSGIYFYRLTVGHESYTQKMMLVQR